jgi:hypothetical protein
MREDLRYPEVFVSHRGDAVVRRQRSLAAGIAEQTGNIAVMEYVGLVAMAAHIGIMLGMATR